jgi:hypothetical protein
MKIPNKVPEKGFYYHYKHDSDKGLKLFGPPFCFLARFG